MKLFYFWKVHEKHTNTHTKSIITSCWGQVTWVLRAPQHRKASLMTSVRVKMINTHAIITASPRGPKYHTTPSSYWPCFDLLVTHPHTHTHSHSWSYDLGWCLDLCCGLWAHAESQPLCFHILRLWSFSLQLFNYCWRWIVCNVSSLCFRAFEAASKWCCTLCSHACQLMYFSRGAEQEQYTC